MELNFDKEMDALLRQAARSGEVVSTNAQNHLDADEISAFAENALPEKTRANYIKHFADCDRCRLILSNTIVLNAEAETASSAASVPAAPVIEPAEAAVPWYRRIFLMPNLAYTMGALVLAVGGMLGFLVFQNLNRGEFNMAQSSANRSAERAPGAVGDEPLLSQTEESNTAAISNAANTAANTSVASATNSASAANANVSVATAANSAANSPLADQAKTDSDDQTRDSKPQAEAGRKDTGIQLDGASGAENRTLAKAAEEKTAKKQESLPPPATPADVATIQAPKPALTPATPAKGDARMAELSRARKSTIRTENTRQVDGKTFNRTGGVWIDSAYNKSERSNMALPPTRTIRRGSDEYRKLDREVRIIAESLEGPVIVVWKTVAYRIQ